MADPLNGDEQQEAPRFERPRDRQEHQQRLVRAASGHRLWMGMRRPWTTWSLLLLMVAVHVALGARMYADGKVDLVGALLGQRSDLLLVRAGGQAAQAIEQGEVWRLVSCIFLHADGLHLFLNAMALSGLGRLCEALYGRARFLALFLVAGVVGATLSWLGGHRLSIGASGAVFGLMGAPIVFGWRHRAELPAGLGDRLRKALLPWVGLNLFIGVLVPFIDNLAHLGGLVAGGAMALVLRNRVVPGREGSPGVGVALVVAAVAILSWAAWGVAGQWT